MIYILLAQPAQLYPSQVSLCMYDTIYFKNNLEKKEDDNMLGAIIGDIEEAAYAYLDEPLKDVLRRWKKYMRSDESWMK